MSTTPVTATSSGSPSWRFTLTRLQREWDRLVGDPRLVARVATWQLPGVVAGATLADVLCAAGMRPAGATSDPLVPPALGAGEDQALERVSGDRVLAALAAAATHDELAARVVLQRLLPGLSSIARRRSRSVEEHLVHTDELLGAAWTVIRSELARERRDFVASSFLKAIEHQVFVRGRRRRLVHELVEPASMDVAYEHEDGAGDALGQIVGVLRSVGSDQLRAGDADLITALLRSDHLCDAARELRVSVRTVRNHRAEMIGRLRDALAA